MPVDHAAKPRPHSEAVLRIFWPPALAIVRLLVRLRVDPVWVVVTHSLLGLLAAALLAFRPEALWMVAVLLQLKTLLDNADGGVARASGRVTQLGRYLDTLMDLLVNFCLFAALARYGPPAAAFGGFVLLTVILSLDHNLEALYRAQRQPRHPDEPVPVGAPRPLFHLVKGSYDLLLGAQDRLIRHLDRAAFERLSGLQASSAPLELRLAWNDMFSTASLVNLGLSTQLLVLGVCLALGHPFWYVLLVYGQAAYVAAVLLARGPRLKRYLQRAHRDA
ncbi:MAG TPA: CDP-alcohol phosphatidyltransferase family protein [Trueperaceae bacterium]